MSHGGDHICPMFWSAIPQGSCTSMIFPNPNQRKAMGLTHIVMLVGCGSQLQVHASSGTQHVNLQQHLLPNSGRRGPRPTLAWQILSPGKHFSDNTGGLATGLHFVLFAKKNEKTTKACHVDLGWATSNPRATCLHLGAKSSSQTNKPAFCAKLGKRPRQGSEVFRFN